MYESQISFTLDTICPWTYLAKKRLAIALQRFQTSPYGQEVKFVVKYYPYQLFPEATRDGEDKYEWYKHSKHNGSEEQMKKYTTLMSAYGADLGINFKFHGKVANTLQAHRLVQQFQQEFGPEVADKFINSLYKQYFEQEQHPSAPATLLKAATDGGINAAKAKILIEDETEGLQETKMLIQEQAVNGVDSVPYLTLEGKRRDFTLVGAKEVEEYVKEMEKLAKETS